MQSVRAEGIRVSRVVPGFVVLPVAGYLIPLLISHPQILTGTAVNMLLVMFAVRYPKRSAAFMCMLPGLGAVTHGLLFGSYTPFVLYFLPFIWMGNYILVSVMQRAGIRRRVPLLVFGAALKAGLLGSTALVFVQYGFVPVMFITAMSWVQFATALAGGFVALGVLRLAKTLHV